MSGAGGVAKISADRFRQISEVSRLIHEGCDFGDLLTRLTEGVCRHSNWAISSVLMMDAERKLSVTAARFDPFLSPSGARKAREWDLAGSPIVEIVAKGRPMIMPDAAEQTTYRAFREDARARGYRTVVMIPLRFPDELGRPIVFTAISKEVVEVDDAELSFLQCLVDLADVAVKRMQQLRQEMEAAERLREITFNMTSALATTLDPDEADDVFGALSHLFPTGWFAINLTTGQLLHDAAGDSPLLQRLARRLPESVMRIALKADARLGERVVRLAVEGETHAALMRPLVIDGTRVGALFLLDVEGLAANEQVAAEAGQLALSAMILRNYMAFRTREHAARRLLGRLCVGELRDVADLREEAQLLGFDLDRPMRLVGLRSLEDEPVEEDAHSFVQSNAEKHFGQALSFKDGAEIYLLVIDGEEIGDPRQRDRFLKRAQLIFPEIVAVMSDRIERLDQIAAAQEACRWNLQVAGAMNARDWVDRRQVGSLASLMAAIGGRMADQFLNDTITRVADERTDKGRQALKTLETFLSTGRRQKETADILGIHVSTLRYRLERISDASGVNLDDPDECFELELALRLHKFRTSYR